MTRTATGSAAGTDSQRHLKATLQAELKLEAKYLEQTSMSAWVAKSPKVGRIPRAEGSSKAGRTPKVLASGTRMGSQSAWGDLRPRTGPLTRGLAKDQPSEFELVLESTSSTVTRRTKVGVLGKRKESGMVMTKQRASATA